MIRVSLAALALALAPVAAIAGPAEDDIVVLGQPGSPFEAAPLAAHELAEMRGGLDLPNGLAIAIGIDIQTRVDGVLVLHTLFASDGPGAGTRVYTDGTAATMPVPGTIVVRTDATPQTPAISVARSPSGTVVTVIPQVGATAVSIVDAPQSEWLTGDGQMIVPVVANGPGITTGPGTFALRSDGASIVSTLTTADLQVSHLLGQATGAVIANTANDRVIDTVSTVNVDLMNVDAVLANAMFLNDALALAIVRGR